MLRCFGPRFDRKQNKELLMFGSHKEQVVLLSSFIDVYLLIHCILIVKETKCIGLAEYSNPYQY